MTRKNSSLALSVLRVLSGRSQKELAAALDLTEGTLSDYERGKKTPSPHLLRRAAEVLGLSPTLTEPTLRLVERAKEARPPEGEGGSGPERRAEAQRLEEVLAEGAEWLVDHLRTALPQKIAEERARLERERAAGLWNRLQRMTERRQRILIEEEEEFRSWALVEVIGEASVKAAAHRADRAVQLAELGVFLAERLDGNEARRASALGLAWAFLGNARRVHGQLPEADEAFARSHDFWAAGGEAGRGQFDESRLLDLEASLRIEQARVDESFVLLDKALRLCRTAEARSRILFIKANALEEDGKYENAIETLREVAGTIPTGPSEPRLRWMIDFSVALNLGRLRRFAEAEDLLPAIRKGVLGLDNDLDQVRVRWLEGVVGAGLGQVRAAIEALTEVRQALAERGITFDAALATLELAEVLVAQGATSEVRHLGRWLAPLLRPEAFHVEALAALAFFRQAAERGTLTLDTAHRLVSYLTRARYNRRLRFEA